MLILCGCAGRGTGPDWSARWPTGSELRDAAAHAVRSPRVWVPLGAAALLTVDDLDEDLADWAADERPLFGASAESDSDDLRTAAEVAWLVSALLAPSPDLTGKAGGLAVGAATLSLEDLITGGIKDAAGRERPDASDDESFSSGHAGTAAAATGLALRNLDHYAMPGWADVSARVALHGVAAGTAWARVEARKHYPTDVLAGYAVGNFLATFMHQAFMSSPLAPMSVSYRPLPDGGALTLTFSSGPRRVRH